MSLALTSGPALEPVTVPEAKAHLRIDSGEEDALVSSLVLTSRLHVEAALGLALVTQAYTLRLDAWPDDGIVRLPVRPVQSITAVRVRDAAGVATALDPTKFALDADTSSPRLVCGLSYAPAPGRVIGGIEIDIVAGFGDLPADVPAPVRHAILQLIAHWYEHRDPVEIGEARARIPDSVSRLLAPYREVRL